MQLEMNSAGIKKREQKNREIQNITSGDWGVIKYIHTQYKASISFKSIISELQIALPLQAKQTTSTSFSSEKENGSDDLQELFMKKKGKKIALPGTPIVIRIPEQKNIQVSSQSDKEVLLVYGRLEALYNSFSLQPKFSFEIQCHP